MMTAPPPELGEPRWHADPNGGGGLRWWDGARWTTAVRAPADPGSALQQPMPAGTVVYTCSIWLIVILTLVPLAGVLAFPFPSGADLTAVSSAPELQRSIDLHGVWRNAVNLLGYGASVALAVHDRRALLRAGYAQPFHWAWAFLSSGVYLIGRSVIVRRRIGRGLAPIWAWAGVSVGILAALVQELMVSPR